MSNDVTVKDRGGIMAEVLIKGDLRNLTPEQQGIYYMKVCESVGLNPLTKPFEYIVLNNKMTLYALRGATDQLRAINKVSVEELVETEREGVFIVTAKVRNGEGRTDIAKGAVNITGLKGEALANALMKAETKAKRRATLSICGLGMLDETEVETIPGAQIVTPEAKSVFKNASLRNKWFENVNGSFIAAKSVDELKELAVLNASKFDEMEKNANEHDLLALEELRKRYSAALIALKHAPSEYTEEPDGIEQLLDPAGEFTMPDFLGKERD